MNQVVHKHEARRRLGNLGDRFEGVVVLRPFLSDAGKVERLGLAGIARRWRQRDRFVVHHVDTGPLEGRRHVSRDAVLLFRTSAL